MDVTSRDRLKPNEKVLREKLILSGRRSHCDAFNAINMLCLLVLEYFSSILNVFLCNNVLRNRISYQSIDMKLKVIQNVFTLNI